MKILIASLAIAVVSVIAFAGVALAADPPAAATSNPGQGFGPAGGCGGNGAGFGPVWSEEVTKLLGLSTDEIQTLRQEGKSLSQIAADKGVSEDALVAAILAPRKTVLQQRVEAKVLTQEQVDLMLKNMEQNIKQSITRTALGPPDTRGTCGLNTGKGIGPGGCGGGRGATWGTSDGQSAPGTGYGMMGGRGMMGRSNRF